MRSVSEVQMSEQWDTLQMYYIPSEWDFVSVWHAVSNGRPWRDTMPHMHHAFIQVSPVHWAVRAFVVVFDHFLVIVSAVCVRFSPMKGA